MSGQSIRRAIGRVIRARGSPAILHFMPLKPFHLDPAQEASAIIALRAKRLSGSDALSGSLPISDWLERLAIPQLSKICRNLAGRCERFVEVASGLGLLFEALKSDWSGPTFPEFVFVGPESDRVRFDLMHQHDIRPYRFGDFDTDRIDARTAVVLNQVQAQRYGFAISDATVEQVLAGPGLPVLVLRVTRGQSGARLTVIGDEFRVASLGETIERLRGLRADLRFAIQTRPDKGFFMPTEDAAKIETLIAFPAEAGLGIEGVKPI
jgi:hypothetical protein